jgi:hypothetical protein
VGKTVHASLSEAEAALKAGPADAAAELGRLRQELADLQSSRGGEVDADVGAAPVPSVSPSPGPSKPVDSGKSAASARKGTSLAGKATSRAAVQAASWSLFNGVSEFLSHHNRNFNYSGVVDWTQLVPAKQTSDPDVQAAENEAIPLVLLHCFVGLLLM